MTSTDATGHDIAVIGAGPGGLASAMLLAASGARVTIYEAQHEVGGRTARVRKGPFAFDRGPTFFLMPYVLEEIYRAAGMRLLDDVKMTRLDPMYRLIVGHPEGVSREPWTIDATQDIAEMSRRIAEIDPSDGANFERFIRDNRAKLLAAEPILRKPIRSLLDLVSGDAMGAATHIKPWHTVHSLLSKYFLHHAVRLAVSFQSKYLGMSPYECPSLFTILPFIEYEYGIWHPEGGCNAIMHSMAGVVRNLGGDVRTNAPVEGLTFEGNRCTGVIVDGEARAHDHVVINADAAWALKNLLPEEQRRRVSGYSSDSQIDRKRYSCSTFMLYLGVDGEVRLPHHTIYISTQYQQNLEDISTNGTLTDDPSIYVCNPSPLDPTLAPEGKSSLYVLVPTPNTKEGVGIDWSAEAPRLRNVALEQMEHRMGIEHVRERIEEEVVVTPDDWRGMNINHGATFNLAHNLNQMLHKRPQHRLQGLDGVWLVGGGTHPGSGLPVIFLSSQITARLLCEEVGLRYAGEHGPSVTLRPTPPDPVTV
ncbi:MAG: phytoene desaturase family protein [Planctomycetota bacterium]